MIVNKFRDLLDSKNITITHLSNITGISRTTLTSLYYKRTEKLSLEVLDKICETLNCTISDIYEYNRESQSSDIVNTTNLSKCNKYLIYYRIINSSHPRVGNILLNSDNINNDGIKQIINEIATENKCSVDDIIVCNIMTL